MTINDITELTVSILTRYYDNDIQPFLEHCHDDILWLGPAKEQIIRTKRALIEAFEKEEHQLKFKVYNMTATPLYISANWFCVSHKSSSAKRTDTRVISSSSW